MEADYSWVDLVHALGSGIKAIRVIMRDTRMSTSGLLDANNPLAATALCEMESNLFTFRLQKPFMLVSRYGSGGCHGETDGGRRVQVGQLSTYWVCASCYITKKGGKKEEEEEVVA